MSRACSRSQFLLKEILELAFGQHGVNDPVDDLAVFLGQALEQAQLFGRGFILEGWVADKWIYTGDRSAWDTHLAYEYNLQGEIIKRQITVGSETLYQHYSYNQRGLLDSVFVSTDGVRPSAPEVAYTYTASGAVDQITYRGGTSVSHGYDIRDRLTDINDIGSTSGSPFAARYNYKKNGNVDWAEFWNPNIRTDGSLTSAHRAFRYDFGYDGLSRLQTADYILDGSNPDAFDVPTITYDGAGNIDLLQRHDQAGALVDNLDYGYTNGTNQLNHVTENASSSHSWDPKEGSFGYDANGNLTSMTGNPTLSNVAYDHRNLPVQMTLDGDTEQINNYNADGQRILKEVQTSSGTTWSFYIKDGLSTLGVIQGGELQYINILGQDVSGRVVANNGSLDADGAKRYYITDHLGSTRAVVDDGGNVLETFDYYPFGLLMPKRSSTTGNTTEKFSGKELDENTNQYYFGARYLDPALGRFFVPDRYADKYPSMTPYQYAANNPINFIDVNGDSVWVTIDQEARTLTVNYEGRLLNDTDQNLDLDQIKDQIKASFEETFGGGGLFFDEGYFSIESNIDLQVAESIEEVSDSDHLLVISDLSELDFYSSGELNKVMGNVPRNSPKVAHIDVRNFNRFFRGNNIRAVNHEQGHQLGLVDVNLPGNLMQRGASGTRLDPKQRLIILQAVFSGSQNRGVNRIGNRPVPPDNLNNR